MMHPTGAARLADDGVGLRTDVWLRFVATMLAGAVTNLAAVLLLPWLLAAVARWARWERLSAALWADHDRVVRMLERLPRTDMRVWYSRSRNPF